MYSTVQRSLLDEVALFFIALDVPGRAAADRAAAARGLRLRGRRGLSCGVHIGVVPPSGTKPGLAGRVRRPIL